MMDPFQVNVKEQILLETKDPNTLHSLAMVDKEMASLLSTTEFWMDKYEREGLWVGMEIIDNQRWSKVINPLSLYKIELEAKVKRQPDPGLSDNAKKTITTNQWRKVRKAVEMIMPLVEDPSIRWDKISFKNPSTTTTLRMDPLEGKLYIWSLGQMIVSWIEESDMLDIVLYSLSQGYEIDGPDSESETITILESVKDMDIGDVLEIPAGMED